MNKWQKQKARLTEWRILKAYSQKGKLGVLNPAEEQTDSETVRRKIYFRQKIMGANSIAVGFSSAKQVRLSLLNSE